jgi:hydroxymethylglutaryl-CoA lyase
LIAAGFTHIDAASFVSRAAVPQMADSEAVLASLEVPAGVEIIGIVVNEKGAERAIKTGRVTTLGYPYSVSPSFLMKNQHQTTEESLTKLRAIQTLARQDRLGLVVYISMAFGNPYDDPWSVQQVMDACARLIDCGVRQISLADTVGLASAQMVTDLVGPAVLLHPAAEIGDHLHAKPADAAALVRAAYSAGCRRFDAAVGGLGGCPFAQEELVGNLPTEILLQTLTELGAELAQFSQMDDLMAANAGIANDFGAR